METRKNRVCLFPSGALLDLPMRDGNKTNGDDDLMSKGLLDLPMRDGNTTARGMRVDGAASFRPSYEGWKLHTLFPIPHQTGAF